MQLDVAASIRQSARQVRSTAEREDAARAGATLARQRLDAEQRRYGVGLSTSFLVTQAQRDLLQAEVNLLQATLDYQSSVVNFEALQLAPALSPGAAGGGRRLGGAAGADADAARHLPRRQRSAAMSGSRRSSSIMSEATLGGRFTFPGTSLTVHRMGYGAMQLAGPGVWGPPRDPDGAVAVLREAVAAGVNHIDTSDFYGPHVTNQIIRQALHPYPAGLVIVTKLGRPPPARPVVAAGHLAPGTDRGRPRQPPQPGPRRARHRQLPRDGVGPRRRGGVDRRAGDGAGRPPAPGADPPHRPEQRHAPPRWPRRRRSPTIVCVQNNYNLAHRHDDALIDDLARQGIAYVPFFPLGGFTPLQSSTLSAVAEPLGATPMQVALAWLLHRSPNILLIPGTSSLPTSARTWPRAS